MNVSLNAVSTFVELERSRNVTDSIIKKIDLILDSLLILKMSSKYHGNFAITSFARVLNCPLSKQTAAVSVGPIP